MLAPVASAAFLSIVFRVSGSIDIGPNARRAQFQESGMRTNREEPSCSRHPTAR
jgi:hypothetical protein